MESRLARFCKKTICIDRFLIRHARACRIVYFKTEGDHSQMDYGMIGKIEKAKRYASQRDRIRIDSLSVTFEGENNDHTVHIVAESGSAIVISSEPGALQPYHGAGEDPRRHERHPGIRRITPE